MNENRIAPENTLQEVLQDFGRGEASELLEDMFDSVLQLEQERGEKFTKTHRQYHLKNKLQEFFDSQQAA